MRHVDQCFDTNDSNSDEEDVSVVPKRQAIQSIRGPNVNRGQLTTSNPPFAQHVQDIAPHNYPNACMLNESIAYPNQTLADVGIPQNSMYNYMDACMQHNAGVSMYVMPVAFLDPQFSCLV